MISRFVANSEKCCKYTFLGGSAQIITILHRGGYQNLLQYYMGGGLPDLLQYYKGGGVSPDPKFVLRNIWTAPNDHTYYLTAKSQNSQMSNTESLVIFCQNSNGLTFIDPTYYLTDLHRVFGDV